MPKWNRLLSKRNLRVAVAGLLVGSLAINPENRLFTEPERPPIEESRILADLHVHIMKPVKDYDALMQVLTSGIIGVAEKSITKHPILTYEEAITLPGVTELEQGVFAKATYNGREGYLIRTQEILPLDGKGHHILALGLRGDYLENTIDIEAAAKEAKRRGSLVVLNHPYTIASPFSIYRSANKSEKLRIENLCAGGLVDAVEIFNAQASSVLRDEVVPDFAEPWPYFWLGRMGRSNDLAKELAKRHGLPGIASSDSHGILSQIGTSGVYINTNGAQLTLDGIFAQIRSGNLETLEQNGSLYESIKEVLF